MPPRLLHSELAAWILGGMLTAFAAVVAFAMLGWLGVALLGLIGLLATKRMELHDGHAVADHDYGSTSVPQLARQVRRQEEATWTQKLAEKERQAKRSRSIYLANTAWIALAAFGFAMFSVHQL